MKRFLPLLFAIALILLSTSCQQRSDSVVGGAILSDLIRPIDGRSMRATSTKTDSLGKPIAHNADNSRVLPGKSTEEHIHPRTEEIYYVLKGKGKVRIEGENITLVL